MQENVVPDKIRARNVRCGKKVRSAQGRAPIRMIASARQPFHRSVQIGLSNAINDSMNMILQRRVNLQPAIRRTFRSAIICGLLIFAISCAGFVLSTTMFRGSVGWFGNSCLLIICVLALVGVWCVGSGTVLEIEWDANSVRLRKIFGSRTHEFAKGYSICFDEHSKNGLLLKQHGRVREVIYIPEYEPADWNDLIVQSQSANGG